MSKILFRSTIKIKGINPYILVSAKRAAQIQKNWRKPLPVRVRVNGHPKIPWRINMMPAGDGTFYLYLHADVRKVSNTKVGDAVAIEVEFDAEYTGGPTHPAPAAFQAALQQNPKAAQAWENLIPSRRKEILRYFSFLKSPEAKARNLQRAMSVLSGGKERFMGRSWNERS